MGALVITATAFVVVLPITAAARQLSDLSDQDLWPFFVIGLLVPGLSQILFTEAVRRTGASRTAILIGTGPLFSALLAVELARRARSCGPCRRDGARRRRRNGSCPRTGAAGGLARARRRARGRVRRALRCSRQRRALGRRRLRSAHPRRDDRDAPGRDSCSCSAGCSRGAARTWEPSYGRSTPAFAPAGVALGLAYASIVAALDRGPVTVVAPLNATQSLWGVRVRGTAHRPRGDDRPPDGSGQCPRRRGRRPHRRNSVTASATASPTSAVVASPPTSRVLGPSRKRVPEPS